MSLWTQTDLDSAKTALLEMLTGQLDSVSFSVGAGSRSVTYNRASMPQLRMLIAEMKLCVDTATNGNTFTIRTEKGL